MLVAKEYAVKHLRLLSIALLSAYFLILFGCSKKVDEPNPNSDAVSELNTQTSVDSAGPSTVEGITVKGMLELWDAGHTDEAVNQFLGIQWGDPSAYRDMPVLTISDKQWRSLSKAEQLRTTKEAMSQTGRLRKVLIEVVSVGKTLAESGDTETAKRHLKAALEYGEALSQSQRFEVVRGHGQAALGYVQQNLAGVLKEGRN